MIIFMAVKLNQVIGANANKRPITCKKLGQIPLIHLQNKSHPLNCYTLYSLISQLWTRSHSLKSHPTELSLWSVFHLLGKNTCSVMRRALQPRTGPPHKTVAEQELLWAEEDYFLLLRVYNLKGPSPTASWPRSEGLRVGGQVQSS